MTIYRFQSLDLSQMKDMTILHSAYGLNHGFLDICPNSWKKSENPFNNMASQ